MSHNNPFSKHASRLSTPVRLGVVAVAACFISAPVLSLPVNPNVVNGVASFNQAGKVLTVTNSNGAIINWNKFSIAAGETTHFAQTAASSTVLNRVLNDPTAIYGTLSSNGRVWLVNPAGIMVGPGGRVDVAGFVASTLNIRNEDFLAGRNVFVNDNGAQNVINQGEIRTPAGGSVYLIGSNVSNEGIITTPRGETILAAGATVSLVDSATPGIKVDITGVAGNATNLGTLTAEAGRIGIAGVIVRNSGTVNASSVVSEGGRVFLKASQDAYVDGNGRIVTTGTRGGSVEVLGNRVAVMDNAEIDASGMGKANASGGSIKVGGDYQGKNPEIQNASITYFGANASLKADAGKVGAGGTVIVWADDTTRAYGTISARGGALGGNGGFVETSGYRWLDSNGAYVDTRAPAGQVGRWLLDPDTINLFAGSGIDSYGGGTFTGSPLTLSTGSGIATMYGANIATALSTTDVVLAADYGGSSSIVVSAGTYSFGSSFSLSLYAKNNIDFNGGTFSNSGSGAINMIAGWNGNFATPATAGTTGSVQLNNTTVSAASGNMKVIAAGAVMLTNGSRLTNGGAFQWVEAKNGSLQLLGDTSGTITSIEYSGAGAQTVYGASIVLQGLNTSGGSNHGAQISSSHPASSQAVTATVGGIDIYGGGYMGSGTNNAAFISAFGSQTISATGALTLIGGAGADQNWAYLHSNGNQSVTAASIALTAGTAGNRAGTYIRGDGDQHLATTAGGITLTAATTGVVYGGYATLVHGMASGNQLIEINGGDLKVYGGGANGLAFSNVDVAPLIDSNCANDSACYGNGVSANYAGISNRSGSTTLNMYGGAILLQGGSGGTANQAYYYNGASAPLMILDADTITVEGGTSGGNGYKTADGRHYLINHAGIQSEGSLSIDAQSIELEGHGAFYGGAFIVSPVVDITTAGNLDLIGGAASNVSGTIDPENAHAFKWQNPAVIGWGAGVADVTLNVGGDLTFNGGVLDSNFGSPAMVAGFGVPANIDITASSVSLNSLYQFSDRIGSSHGGSVKVTVNGVYGGIALGKGLVGTNRMVPGGWVDLTSEGGNITQDPGGRISTPDLSVSAYADGAEGGIDLYSSLNRVGWLDAKITGPGFHDIDFRGDSVTLYNIDTTYGGGSGSVVVWTDYGIYETDPGNTDIRAGSGNVGLYSNYGGLAGGLAISADVNTSGTLFAKVDENATYGGAYGGIRIQANGQMPSFAHLLDRADFNTSIDFYRPVGDISAPGNLHLYVGTPGPIRVRAGGAINGAELLNMGDGGQGYPNPSRVTLEAGTTLTVNGALYYDQSDIDLIAVGQLLVTSTGQVDGRNVTLIAPSTNLYGGVTAHGDSSTPAVINGQPYVGIGFIADNLSVYGPNGRLEAFDSTADISGLATNNISLHNGASFTAGHDIDLTLASASSTLNLSNGSYLLANSPDTIFVRFQSRSTPDGILINGIATTTNGAGDTGFYLVTRPTGAALVGAGLSVSYAAPPPPPPLLADCIANPVLPGCAAVLPTLANCTTAPSTPGCSVVLPTLASCTTAPSTPGCSAVLPTLASCTTAPSTPGCSAVLPTLASCTTAPSTPGCSAVLPTLASCTTAPSTPGCSAVLPPTPTPPSLADCTANPGLAGCSAILPTLADCTATPGLPGCSAVLALNSTTNDTTNSIVNELANLTNGANNPINDGTSPPPSNAGSGALAGNQSVGGGDGAFGDESNGTDDKKGDKKDEKKSDQTTADGKKNDKPAHKKVAQCS